MFAHLTPDKLLRCLVDVPPVELKSVELLRQLRATTGAWFPPTAIDLTEATTELIDYTSDCERLAQRLSSLAPICLTMVPIWEFAL